MNTRNRTRIAAVTLLTSLVAGVVVATITLSPARTPSLPSNAPIAHVHAPMVGVPTGEVENGVPVYRLPPVTVAVSRSAALAEIAREEQLALK